MDIKIITYLFDVLSSLARARSCQEVTKTEQGLYYSEEFDDGDDDIYLILFCVLLCVSNLRA